MSKDLYLFLFILISTLACTKTSSEKASHDFGQIHFLHQKTDSLDADSSIQYLSQAAQLIQSFQQVPDSLKAAQQYYTGLYFFKKGNLDSAALYLHQAIDYVKDSISRPQEVDYFRKTWAVYFRQGKYGDCTSISQRLKLLLSENDYQYQALIHYFNENIYKRERNVEEAIKSNQLRIKMLELSKDTNAIITAYVSQAAIKASLLRDLPAALKILEDLLRQQTNLSDHQKHLLLNDYGVYLFYDQRFKEAREVYLKSLNTIPDIPGRRDLLANAYSNVAEVNIELKNYPLAEIYLDSVEQLGLRNIEKSYRRNAMQYKLRLLAESGKGIGCVLAQMDTIFKIEDDLYKDKYDQDLRELEKSNERKRILEAEKQAEIIKGIKRKNLIIGLLVAFFLVAIIGYFGYRQRRFTFENESLQMQQRLLRSQMNPHFTFNTLYAIQSQLKKDPQKSKSYLLKFSRLLRLILENSTHNYVHLEKELEAIRAYLDLQLLRSPSTFEYEINFKNLDEEDLVFIPPMLLQPLVENSIEHGFAGINYTGKLSIFLERKNKFLFCKIEDNGRGLEATQTHKERSISMQLITDFLKKTTGKTLEIIQKNDTTKMSSGVVVQFLIPYKLTDND